MKVLDIIPARGAPKEIESNNLIPFNGKPLLAHSIIAAVDSRLVNRVIIASTDDGEIGSTAL